MSGLAAFSYTASLQHENINEVPAHPTHTMPPRHARAKSILFVLSLCRQTRTWASSFHTCTHGTAGERGFRGWRAMSLNKRNACNQTCHVLVGFWSWMGSMHAETMLWPDSMHTHCGIACDMWTCADNLWMYDSIYACLGEWGEPWTFWHSASLLLRCNASRGARQGYDAM